VTINNPYTKSSKNLDCIDPAGSNIHIADCTLTCGDDNVAVKGPSSNVLVEDCWFGTGHGASIGSITDTVVKNVTFRNIVMNGTENGCRVKTAKGYKGGSVSYITYENITMHYVKHPIVITGAYSSPAPSPVPAFSPSDSASISHVSFTNIHGTNCTDKCELECTSGEKCTDLLLNNVNLQPDKKAECSNAEGKVVAPVFPSSLASCFT